MSPNIDQNSSPKERVKKNKGKKLLTLKKCPPSRGIHPTFQSRIALREEPPVGD
jgi:hypothetical protein